MQAKRRAARKDEYSIFETLRAKGVAVPPFATSMEDVGSVGIPAIFVTRHKNKAPERTMITKYGDIARVFAHAAHKSPQFFMQRHIAGHEVACGVMADGRKIMPLVPVEIIPRSLHESGPWHMRGHVADAVQACALKAHKAMGGKKYSCVRFTVDGTTPYVTAVDIAPALTRTGLFMRSAEVAGFTAAEIKESIGIT
jgi:D-alanine-D-alanine ligase-like ATP-grasp enzyme